MPGYIRLGLEITKSFFKMLCRSFFNVLACYYVDSLKMKTVTPIILTMMLLASFNNIICLTDIRISAIL